MSYYSTINNVKYDRKLIELAEKYKTCDDTLSWESVNAILHSCKDAGVFTQTEYLTIKYINDQYSFDYDTKQLLELILFLCSGYMK